MQQRPRRPSPARDDHDGSAARPSSLTSFGGQHRRGLEHRPQEARELPSDRHHDLARRQTSGETGLDTRQAPRPSSTASCTMRPC